MPYMIQYSHYWYKCDQWVMNTYRYISIPYITSLVYYAIALTIDYNLHVILNYNTFAIIIN